MNNTKLYLTAFARQKLRYFVDLCPEEISGFGKLEVKMLDGIRYLVMTDLAIFKQECTSAHSTIDDDAMGKFLYEQTKAGEDLSKWKVWWHSHAKMEAFFSATDTGTIDKSKEFPYLVSLVSNHKGALVARLDIFDPIRHTETLTVETLPEENEELKKLCQKEIDEKVTLGRILVPKMGYHNSGWQDIHKDDKPLEGTKKWRKLKHKKQVLTRGDLGFHWDSKEVVWDSDLQTFVLPKSKISISKDSKTSTILPSGKNQSRSSELETLDHKHVLDLDDLD